MNRKCIRHSGGGSCVLHNSISFHVQKDALGPADIVGRLDVVGVNDGYCVIVGLCDIVGEYVSDVLADVRKTLRPVMKERVNTAATTIPTLFKCRKFRNFNDNMTMLSLGLPAVSLSVISRLKRLEKNPP
jgi:hypothetical protein